MCVCVYMWYGHNSVFFVAMKALLHRCLGELLRWWWCVCVCVPTLEGLMSHKTSVFSPGGESPVNSCLFLPTLIIFSKKNIIIILLVLSLCSALQKDWNV